MYKLLYTLSLTGIFLACGAPSGQQSAATEDTTATTAVAVNGKPGDPVCEMPYDTSYTEFSVHKGDTVYFCSATCKGVFDKNPEKYAAKLK
ncbi:MAG TPA: YHS domain-containing protein [Chitinophaga sp.]